MKKNIFKILVMGFVITSSLVTQNIYSGKEDLEPKQTDIVKYIEFDWAQIAADYEESSKCLFCHKLLNGKEKRFHAKCFMSELSGEVSCLFLNISFGSFLSALQKKELKQIRKIYDLVPSYLREIFINQVIVETQKKPKRYPFYARNRSSLIKKINL